MAIRFYCPACTRPIEVDDEWVSRRVTCPYCRRVISAPSESLIGDAHVGVGGPPPVPPGSASEGEASPHYAEVGGRYDAEAGMERGVASPGWESAPIGAPPVRRPVRRGFAIAALVLTGLLLVGVICTGVISVQHEAELLDFMKDSGSGRNAMEGLKLLSDRHGGQYPSWFMTYMLASVSMFVLWPAALVCSIVALVRREKRALAIPPFVACVLLLLFFVCSGLSTVMTGNIG
jgi:hypothetical protein